MKGTTEFAALAALAESKYGPAATLRYILEQAEQRTDNAKVHALDSLRSALDGCSLSRHPLVVDQRFRKAQRKLQKMVNRQAATAMAIAVLLTLLPKRKADQAEEGLTG